MKLTYNRIKQLNSIFDNIVNHYGFSRYSNDLPDLIIIHDDKDGSMGTFEDESEEIVLNLFNCRTVKDAVGTMIHEYCHYLQPRNGWYDRYARKYKYSEHPYEIQANEMADRDLHLFI